MISLFQVLLLLFMLLINLVNCVVVNARYGRNRAVLAKRTDYDGGGPILVLEWRIDWSKATIIFELTARTSGYVGFGLKRPWSSASMQLSKTNGTTTSRDGMADSDLVIGGIYPNGTSYFTDYHGKGNFAPVPDESQDWQLHVAWENATHTFLRFSRPFDTCDEPDDVPILSMKPLKVLWALGSSDEFTYHGRKKRHRGKSRLILLTEQPLPEVPVSSPLPSMTELRKHLSWTTMTKVTMNGEYSYQCTFYRGPGIYGSNHAVAFIPLLTDSFAARHVHHFSFYHCKSPEDGSFGTEIYEPHVASNRAYDCYSDPQLPVASCMNVLYVWSPGEKGVIFPPEVGYLLNGNARYFMLEVHYENPGRIYDGFSFPVGIEVFYTPQLRPHNAGFMAVAHAVSNTLFIPPHSREWKIEGRCTSKCTEKVIPTEGVTVMNVMLHAHLYARKIKLRHFRGSEELPWLADEHEFDFNSQKMKPLSAPRKILPGDSLVIECTYNTISRDTVVTGSFSSTGEMCTAFLWYFPQVPLDDCSSRFPDRNLNSLLHFRPFPEAENGLDFASFVDSNILWEDGIRTDLQKLLISSNHKASCIISDKDGGDNGSSVRIAPPIVVTPDKVYRPRKTLRKPTNINNDNNISRCKKSSRVWWKKTVL